MYEPIRLLASGLLSRVHFLAGMKFCSFFLHSGCVCKVCTVHSVKPIPTVRVAEMQSGLVKAILCQC